MSSKHTHHGRRAIVWLAVFAVIASGAAFVPQPAGAAGRFGLATPDLITHAEQSGRIGHDAAFVLRLKAFRGAPLPSAYRSPTPWRGTELLLRMRRYMDHGGRARFAARGPFDPLIQLAQPVLGLLGLAPGAFDCDLQESPQLRGLDSEHFHFQYSARRQAGGLFLRDYADAFEKAWRTEIGKFGWAAPPPPKNRDFGGRYLVVIDKGMQPLVYGFTAPTETVGDNPATPWNDIDAQSSCISVSGRFDNVEFPGGGRVALESTAAHEFLHSIQFGMGALNDDSASLVLTEASATWMEDEVFDAANDNYNYLWPTLSENMATHSSTVYGYFIVFRALAERLGADGQRFMRDLWELTSQRRARDVHAVAAALGARGIGIGQAFHDVGIAVSVIRPCGGGYALPYCFEEAEGYKAVAGPARVDAVLARGATYDGTVEDDLAMRRFALPTSGADYSLTLSNKAKGGVLRASAVCDTGKGLRISSLPTTLGPGAVGRIPLNVTGCSFVRMVVSNEAISAGYPESVPARRFTLAVS